MRFKRISCLMVFFMILLTAMGCTQKRWGKDKIILNIKKNENWTSVNDEIFISTAEENKVNMILVKSGKEAVIIDAGYDEKQALKIKEYIDENNLEVSNIIITYNGENQTGTLELFSKNNNIDVMRPRNIDREKEIKVGDKVITIYPDFKRIRDNLVVDIDNQIFVGGEYWTTGIYKTEKIITRYDFRDLLEHMEMLKDKEYALVIPGYGEISKGDSLIIKNYDRVKDIYTKHDIVDKGVCQVVDDDIIVANGSYGFVNLVLVTSGKKATLIDTGNDYFEANIIKKYIEDNDLILENLILTHNHADHANNKSMFAKEDVTVYEYKEELDNHVIQMGDKKINIILTPGHFYNFHMSVEIDDKILVAGDVITSNFTPNEMLRWGGDKEKLISTLEGLKKKKYELIIPGHGNICLTDSVIYDHLEVLGE